MSSFCPILFGLSLFQPLLCFLDLLQAALSTTELFGKLITAIFWAVFLIFLSIGSIRLPNQIRDFLFQPLLFLLHPVVAHRLMPAGVGFHLRPIDRDPP